MLKRLPVLLLLLLCSCDQSTPSAASRPSTQPDSIVYVTRTGRKYHAAGCQMLRKSATTMKLTDAQARGYTACAKCGG